MGEASSSLRNCSVAARKFGRLHRAACSGVQLVVMDEEQRVGMCAREATGKLEVYVERLHRPRGVHQVRQATRTTETAYPGVREHRFLLELNTVNRPKLFETACKEGREIENTESSFNDFKLLVSDLFLSDSTGRVPGT